MSRAPAPRKGLLHIRQPKSSTPQPRRPGVGSGSGSLAIPSASRGPAAKGGDSGYLYLAGVRDTSNRAPEYSSASDICPSCQTDRQFNPSLRLLVSPCYHRLCESCIDRLFTMGPEPCPQCGKLLRKMNFQHQTFEDLRVEREVSVRKRMAEYFNKRQEDFESARAYDDYLEKVEEWTFNLLNEVNTEATEAAITSYRRENAEVISANQSLAQLDALSQVEKDELDRIARAERRRLVEEAERIEAVEADRLRVEVVDALARPDGGKRAQELRARHEMEKDKRGAALQKAISEYTRRMGLGGKNGRRGEEDEEMGEKENTTDPNRLDYTGVFVPIPYADPELQVYKKWYDRKRDYVDGRSWVMWARQDGGKNVRGGEWDLGLFWEREVECAVMSLGVEPLR